MKLLSINVGLPREIEWRGREFETGIFKVPVEGSVLIRSLNLEGDRQADLTVHGGANKAVYGYPSEHYSFWKEFLGLEELAPGAMGENLTTEGLLEDELHIGDVLQVGSVELVVTQPRTPCFKLQAKFDREDLVKEFLFSGFSGFYFAVAKEGSCVAGDAITILSRDPRAVKVSDLNRIQRRESIEPELLRRAVEVEALPEEWRKAIQKTLPT